MSRIINTVRKVRSPDQEGRELPLNHVQGELLGRDAFGTVYIAYERETREVHAVKFLPVRRDSFPKEVKSFSNKIDLMKRLSHKHIVQYYGSADDLEGLCFFMEYMPGGSLRDEITRNGPLGEHVARKYTKQIIDGLVYLHSKKILHRDVKCAHVLKDTLDGPANIKLCGFGISKHVETITSISGHSAVGTPHWMSPEVIRGENYGARADVWSLGITVIEMLTGNPPWHELDNMQALYKIATDAKVDLPSHVTQDCRDFLRDIFVEREQRPYPGTISEHRWVKNKYNVSLVASPEVIEKTTEGSTSSRRDEYEHNVKLHRMDSSPSYQTSDLSVEPTTSHSSTSNLSCTQAVETGSLDGARGIAVSAASKLSAKIELDKFLGMGGFGQVYLAHDIDTGRNVAVKRAPVHSNTKTSNGNKKIEALKREIALLSKLSDEHVIQFFGSDEDSEFMYLFMEYMSEGSLRDEIKKNGALSEQVARRYTRQIIDGLSYLHRENVFHLDVKCANVLQDESGNIKLADFGISVKMEKIGRGSGKARIGSGYWTSPEVIRNEEYGPKADIWSAGCTVIEMLTTNPPWHKLEIHAAVLHIAKPSYPEIPSNFSQNCRDFLNVIFVESDLRPDSEEISKHCWLNAVETNDMKALGTDLASSAYNRTIHELATDKDLKSNTSSGKKALPLARTLDSGYQTKSGFDSHLSRSDANARSHCDTYNTIDEHVSNLEEKAHNLEKNEISYKALSVEPFVECDEGYLMTSIAKLVRDICENQPCCIDELEFSGCNVQKEHLEAFCNGIKHMILKLSKLCIAYNRESVRDMMHLCSKIINICGTSTLILVFGKLTEDSMNVLWKGLSQNNKLDMLDISYSQDISPHGFYLLGRIVMEHDVKILKAVDCNISDDELRQFFVGTGKLKSDDKFDGSGSKITEMEELDFSYSDELSADGLGYLGDFVKNVQKLKLTEIHLTTKTIKAFHEKLKAFEGSSDEVLLKELHVNYNGTLEADGYAYLGKIVKICKIQRLNLAGCEICVEHLQALREKLEHHHLISLDISDNTTSENILKEIAEIVIECGIEELDISGCMLSADELRHFNEALGNEELRYLNLSDSERNPDKAYVEQVCTLLSKVEEKMVLVCGMLREPFRLMLQNNLEKTKNKLQIVLDDEGNEILCSRKSARASDNDRPGSC